MLQRPDRPALCGHDQAGAQRRLFHVRPGGAGYRRCGHPFPTAITSAIPLVLALWTAYALSAAGWLPVLPGRRLVLGMIIAILGGRGIAGLLIGWLRPGYNGARFWYASSLTCLALAGLYAAGTAYAWPTL